MRKLLLLCAAMIVAAPVLAQPVGRDDDPAYDVPLPGPSDEEAWEDEDYGDEDFGYEDRGGLAPPIVHPGQIEAMGGAMDRLLGAVMNLPIGGIAAAMDPYGRGNIPPGATVRDMATRDDPFAEQKMRAGIRGATRGVGAMSQALARVMPVLERTIDEFGREVEAAVEQAEPR